MSNASDRVHFWNHLLYTAELIETQTGDLARTTVLEQLATIHEAFAEFADPVENYEEYTVVRLSQAIHTAFSDYKAAEPDVNLDV